MGSAQTEWCVLHTQYTYTIYVCNICVYVGVFSEKVYEKMPLKLTKLHSASITTVTLTEKLVNETFPVNDMYTCCVWNLHVCNFVIMCVHPFVVQYDSDWGCCRVRKIFGPRSQDAQLVHTHTSTYKTVTQVYACTIPTVFLLLGMTV